MYVVSLEFVLSMRELVPHETLLENGTLQELVDEDNAMFLGHDIPNLYTC